jgi:hypothetical protein
LGKSGTIAATLASAKGTSVATVLFAASDMGFDS